MTTLRFLLLLALSGCLACSRATHGSRAIGRPSGEWMVVPRVAVDLVASSDAWTVRRARPDEAPSAGVVCPSLHYEQDGADMASLVLPPPAEVMRRVPADAGALVLRGRVGVDVSAARQLTKAHPEGRVVFEVQVDGRVAFRNETTIRLDYPRKLGTEWRDIGGEQGIVVSPGSELVLRTRALDASGEEITPPVPLRAGFGGLRLETSVRIARTASSQEAPNLVLVVMDTLRADRLGAYGARARTSPHLDALAASGVLFENAYATSSWTWPSTASILTGLEPDEHGVRDSASCYLASDLVTVAEILQSAGVSTAAWTANPLIHPTRGFAQGFERFEADGRAFRKAGSFFPEVERWLGEQEQNRFFLYLHLVEPHEPYDPLPEARALLASGVPEGTGEVAMRLHRDLPGDPGQGPIGRARMEERSTAEERAAIRRLYDACVWSGDRWLGELRATLDRLGLSDRTVLVFTSDHGEELFDHHALGHGKSLYQEVVHVPLVIAGPGVPRGARIESILSNRCVAPLLASFAGASLGSPFERESFFDLGAPDRTVFFSTEHGHFDTLRGVRLRGMRQGRFTLQLASIEDKPDTPRPRLFDLQADPGETHDLAASDPEQAAQLLSNLRQHFDSLEPASSMRVSTEGAGTQALLDRIGYTGQ